MPINDGSANFLQKAGDTDDGVAVKRVAIVVRQADDTGEDASAAFPMPVESPNGALALEATQLVGNTSIGATTDAVAVAGGAGSLNAKLRLATDQLNSMGADLSDAVNELEDINVAIGPTTDAAVVAGAEGAVNAQLRRLTTDIDAINAKMCKDDATGCQSTIDFEHKEIHESAAFTVHNSATTASTDDHRTGIAFTTPAGAKKLHLTVTVSASDPAEFFLLEAPTNTDATAGVDKAVLNRDRVNSATASIVLSLEASPTAGSVSIYDEAAMVTAAFTGGTELDYTLLAGGDGPFAVGGADRSEHEFILKVSTTYVFYIQNIGANANIHSISLNWYEHTDAA